MCLIIRETDAGGQGRRGRFRVFSAWKPQGTCPNRSHPWSISTVPSGKVMTEHTMSKRAASLISSTLPEDIPETVIWAVSTFRAGSGAAAAADSAARQSTPAVTGARMRFMVASGALVVLPWKRHAPLALVCKPENGGSMSPAYLHRVMGMALSATAGRRPAEGFWHVRCPRNRACGHGAAQGHRSRAGQAGQKVC